MCLFCKQGAVVIDNSSVFRLNKDIPLIVPEINGKELSELFSLSQSGSQNRREAGQAPINRTGKIISNPNCSTIQTAVCLAPLHRVFTLKEVYICTYQAVSGAGAGALYDFDHPMLKPETLPFPICSNLIPFIGEIDASGSSREENKIRLELKKILDCDIPVNAHTVRVPVRNCHGIAIFARFEKTRYRGSCQNTLGSTRRKTLYGRFSHARQHAGRKKRRRGKDPQRRISKLSLPVDCSR